jgi:outer membrane murein-binding lipoprotein Lpp
MKRAGGFRFSYSGSIVNRLVETTMQARFPFASSRIRHALLLSAAAAACAAPLLAVHAAPPSDGLKAVHAMHRSEGGEPYALVRAGSRVNMTGDKVDGADIEGIKRSVQGEFFWFRKDGKEYIVQDAATLARVRQAWAPMEKTGAEMEKQGKEMGRHGEAMGAYGTRMALAAATFNQAKMEALGKQMEEAGKPMEALGKKMEVLGEQMEAQQKEADRATRGIISEALANGVARPAPKRS